MDSTSYYHSPLTSFPASWDVFLSFRGIDTRYIFTDYLYDALQRTGIRTFREESELSRGELISDALVQAISESKTYVVILSKNYASSSWCLDELVAILDIYERMKRSVIVLFYIIDPSDVRHQTGSFKKAFEQHKICFNIDTLDKWRATLNKVANLSGYRVCKNMSQADIINKVVDRILLEINSMTLEVAKYPVRLDSRLRDITALLSSNPEGVAKIGLHNYMKGDLLTRNDDLLDSIKVEASYKVKELGDAESLQLFTQRAFKESYISGTFTELSKEILKHAGGLPLALKVFGSNLFNQSEEGWRWFLEKLKQGSINDIEKKLLVSFNALKLVDPILQDIFLDIACFFNGSLAGLVCLNLIGCVKLKGLPHTLCNSRSLEFLSIGNCKSLEALPTELENIETLKGLNAEGLTISELPVSIGHLTKLVKLNLSFIKNLETLPDTVCNLRGLEVLSIRECISLKALPKELGNIVSLKELHAESLTVSKLPVSVGRLSKLVNLGLNYNKNLETLPDTISNLRGLEVLSIRNCISLETFPKELGNIASLKVLDAEGLTVSVLPVSIGHLSELVKLGLNYNKNLETLPDTICNLRQLEVLSISHCTSLESLPIELGNTEFLKELDVDGLKVSSFPVSIRRLNKLVKLDLSYNKNLETFPTTIWNLRTLEALDISHCTSLKKLPMELGYIQSLKELNAQGLCQNYRCRSDVLGIFLN